MKLKIRVLPFVLAGVFAIAYILVAAFPLSQEIQFKPEWTISVFQNIENSLGEKSFPFKVGQNAGYFSSSGKILNSTTFPVKISISDSFYAPFGLSNDEIPVYSPDGKFVCKMEASGFPFIDDDRLFVFFPGGASFAQFSTEGKKMWSYEGFIPVTSFASSEGGSAAGFADGKVLAFNTDGSVKLEFVPGGSKYPVILGLDISHDGSLLACLSGLEKQRIVLSRIEKDHSVITFYKYLEKDQIRQSFVQFSEDGDWLYYSFAGGLGIVKCSSGKCTELKMEGFVTSIKYTDIPGTMFVLTKKIENSANAQIETSAIGTETLSQVQPQAQTTQTEKARLSEDVQLSENAQLNDYSFKKTKKYTVYVIENYTKNAGSFSFDADVAFIETNGSDLFIGRDSKISKIKISNE